MLSGETNDEPKSHRHVVVCILGVAVTLELNKSVAAVDGEKPRGTLSDRSCEGASRE